MILELVQFLGQRTTFSWSIFRFLQFTWFMVKLKVFKVFSICQDDNDLTFKWSHAFLKSLHFILNVQSRLSLFWWHQVYHDEQTWLIVIAIFSWDFSSQFVFFCFPHFSSFSECSENDKGKGQKRALNIDTLKFCDFGTLSRKQSSRCRIFMLNVPMSGALNYLSSSALQWSSTWSSFLSSKKTN